MMKNNILYVILLCFICLSCSNYIHLPQNINKIGDEGREGLWVIKNDTTGMIIFVRYKANLETGKYKKYHFNGQIAAEGKYKNGKRVGHWTFYFSDGSLSAEMYYERDGTPRIIRLTNPRSW